MKKSAPLLLLSLLLSSCSVIMASKTSGADIDSVQSVQTRIQLIALGAEPILTEKNEKGELIETYRILKENGSIARAFMHGLLDISTAFLWELAGTPIESALTEKKYYSVKVTYDNQERIQKMELF
ncbi:MAG: hypothetical protein V4487_03495 [Chlamydiota bacterium]